MKIKNALLLLLIMLAGSACALKAAPQKKSAEMLDESVPALRAAPQEKLAQKPMRPVNGPIHEIIDSAAGAADSNLEDFDAADELNSDESNEKSTAAESTGAESSDEPAEAEDLLSLAHQRRRLLEGGDPLDVDALLGRGPTAVVGKTRLTVVNTQFLGDPVTTDFWVSQFLLAVDRWRAKNPAPDGTLQAVFLFDEADPYLPAVGKPAAKGPMESLLRRGRSAGIGIFLATQSPGDFDYKCRDQILTWLVGRVQQPVAINKLKPMFEAGRADVTGKLPGQKAGQFFLVRESDVVSIQADRNLIPTAQLSEDRVLAAARRDPRH